MVQSPFLGHFSNVYMTFGERITHQRKQQKWSQDELAKQVGTSAPIIGRYERDEIKPSIEVAAKIATALGVTVDYLISGSMAFLDKESAKRIQEIQDLNPEDQQHIFTTLDALIRDAKARKAYQ